MEPGILKEMASVIRAEWQRRRSRLKDLDPEIAYDQWLFDDCPLINELCLMLLVTLRHEVDRELVGLAARSADGGREIEYRDYHENVKRLRKGISWNWDVIRDRLRPESSRWWASMECLRLLANSYKHDHSAEPADDLKKFLDLPEVSYATLPNSDLFRERLAVFIGLEEAANYCDIAEHFVSAATDFLKDVESRANLSNLKLHLVSPTDFAY